MGAADAGRATSGPRAAAAARSAPRDQRSVIEQRPFDPRREQRRQAARVDLPEDVTARMLDAEVRAELRSLSKETADLVARHLVVAGRLLDDDPEAALAHARAARALAARVGVVREAAGLAAYAAQDWGDALSELRAARRITGQPGHLAVMADCERALGRPERALPYLQDKDVPRLAQAERVELVIVVSGARRDLGQADAAVLVLQEPARRSSSSRPWAARLRYALADALLDAGREDDARMWFEQAADADGDGETDAAERVLEMDGVVFPEAGEDDGPQAWVVTDPLAAAAGLEAALARAETADPPRVRADADARHPAGQAEGTRPPGDQVMSGSSADDPDAHAGARGVDVASEGGQGPPSAAPASAGGSPPVGPVATPTFTAPSFTAAEPERAQKAPGQAPAVIFDGEDSSGRSDSDP